MRGGVELAEAGARPEERGGVKLAVGRRWGPLLLLLLLGVVFPDGRRSCADAEKAEVTVGRGCGGSEAVGSGVGFEGRPREEPRATWRSTPRERGEEEDGREMETARGA